MSFSFNAVGTRPAVLRQLRATDTYGNVIGEAIRTAIIAQLESVEEASKTGPGHEYAYTVKAHGHSGPGSPLTLNVQVEPLWVPAHEVSHTRSHEAASLAEARKADGIVEPEADGGGLADRVHNP